ncbi:MAG TPA: CDP-alcohol phosphatidyltransferase family protein [Candidatus Obscuribacterales bacterium]
MLIGYLNPPNLVTLTGMIFALAAGMLAMRGYLGFAMVGLIVAGICDLFDGFVARRSEITPEEQAFGAELDSLNDVVCFGLLPVVLLDSWLHSVWIFPVYAVYLIAVLFRLAWFNIYGVEADAEGSGSYTGLPVTYAALALPLTALLAAWVPMLKLPVLLGTLLALAGLYVYKLPIPKPAGKAYIAFPVMALLVSLLWLWQPWGRL